MEQGYLWFLVTAVIVELTPGPNMTWLAVVAAAEGRRAGLMAVAGVALGLTLVGLAAAAGLAVVVQLYPAVYQALRWGGTLWLLWLAWEAWQDAADPDPAGAVAARRRFGQGLLTNLLNPKAAVFYLAILPRFLDPGRPVLAQTIWLSLSYVAVATAIHAGIVALAAMAQLWLTDPVRVRPVRRALALVLAGVAVWFLVSTGT